jgi:two-component system NtrC family sensor kinase
MLDAPATAASPQHAGRLLVVDDEENILRTIKRVLRKTGWEIETAPDGAAGLSALDRFKPEVVISDFRMPGMTGVEFLAAVKSQSPQTQRIMLTGQADQTAIEDAINRSEIFRFISKPWNDAQLVLTIKSAFEQRALQLENERLHALARQQNDELRTLNHSLEERVQARTAALSTAKREWEATFDTLDQPVAIVSTKDLRVLRANRAFASSAKRDIREIGLNPSCHQFLFGRDSKCAGCPLIYGSDKASAGEVEHDGRLYEVRTYPIAGEERAVCSYRDVTDERAMTIRMIETEKMAAVGQLAGGVAHEINNPLGGVLAFSQLMQRDAGRSEQDLEALKIIEEAALRCKRIVESLLKFSRRGSSEERVPLDLSRTLEETAMLFKAQMKTAPKATLTLKLDRTLEPVRANGVQLGQVLLNLLQNALYALPARVGAITIESGHEGERVFFRVTDEGSGIDAAHLPRIFEPSFTTKPPGEGTGLGLSIAYRIVSDHGGEFAVDSTPGKGSRFTVFLPKGNQS